VSRVIDINVGIPDDIENTRQSLIIRRGEGQQVPDAQSWRRIGNNE